LLFSFAASFLALLGIGVPIAVALGGSALVYILLKGDLSLTLLIQTTFAGIASFPLLAIPLFLLAGHLMKESGMMQDLARFARLILGHLQGGLGLATILASAVFAAISGSAVATAVAIGAIMLPAMRSAGYDEDVSASLTATAACMGPIIPPSIPFIIYGVIANVSVASLFLAGVIPGALLGIGLMIYIHFIAGKRQYEQELRAGLPQILAGTLQALPALLMPVIVMGGIWGGVFTPTEAAGIAVAYAFVMGFCFYRRLSFRRLPALFLTASLETAVVMLLLGLSEGFAWVIAVEQLPARMAEAAVQISHSPYVFLMLVNIFLLLLGIPLETAPALTIVTPVLAPMAEKMGIDPIHFGVIVCFNLVLGLITPPVGAVLFSICSMTGLSLEKLSRGILLPFLIAVAVLLIVTFVPALSTYLPNLLANTGR
jgi:C4-dicarboxylate transporter DctM subunit